MNYYPGVLRSIRTSPAGRRLIALLAVSVLAVSMNGCYGRFPLTNAIYRWNGRVTNNHVANSIIMIVLAIFPVYWLAIIIDAIIINSIEFWDGERVEVSKTYTQPDGTTVVLAPGGADNEAVLTVFKDDVLVAKRTYVRDEQGVTTILNEDGDVLSRVTPDGNGGFAFTNATGETTGGISASQIATLKQGGAIDPTLRDIAL